MKVKMSLDHHSSEGHVHSLICEHETILDKAQHCKKSDSKISDEFYKNKPSIRATSKSFKMSASFDEEHEKRPKKK
jgi:hypothetical protein